MHSWIGLWDRQRDLRVMRLSESLVLHAQSEEQVFYPAAVLVGDLVRARLSLR